MNKKESLITRRQLLNHGIALGSLGALASVGWTAGCGGKEKAELSCNDTTGLSPADVSLRTSLKYADQSPDPTKLCEGCQLYKPGQPDQCGGCQLFKGPVHPKGNCTSWVQKTS
jgi:hypothetical protein